MACSVGQYLGVLLSLNNLNRCIMFACFPMYLVLDTNVGLKCFFGLMHDTRPDKAELLECGVFRLFLLHRINDSQSMMLLLNIYSRASFPQSSDYCCCHRHRPRVVQRGRTCPRDESYIYLYYSTLNSDSDRTKISIQPQTCDPHWSKRIRPYQGRRQCVHCEILALS